MFMSAAEMVAPVVGVGFVLGHSARDYRIGERIDSLIRERPDRFGG